MKKIFLDTNVVIDLLDKREPFYVEAAAIFTLAYKKKVTLKVVDDALASSFIDYEDALQYYSALNKNVDAIITRNVKDFVCSKIPVLTPVEYLSQL